MAFPFIFQSNFEQGTAAEWDSEADTGSLLSFPHYSALAAIPGAPMPYSGAYCMMIDLRAGDTNDHTLTEGDIDIASAATRYFRWMMFIPTDFVASANDNFSILELQHTDATKVFVVGLTITATTDAITVWVAEGDTPETTSTLVVPKGKWVCFEVEALADTDSADADMSVYVDGTLFVSIATPVQNATAVGQGALGTQNTLATTTGILYFDAFVMDDARLYPPAIRFPTSKLLTKTGHAFVGPGKIDAARLMSGAGTDCVLTIYDTDVGNSDDYSKVVLELKNTANSQLVTSQNTKPIRVERGCYVVLAGTTPRAIIDFCGTPAFGSDGAIRTYGARRKPTPLNV